jgi:hypothetical protein
MLARARELEVVGAAGHAEHHAVEAVVVLEAIENVQPQAAAVHLHGAREIADRPRDAQMGVTRPRHS